MKKSSIIYGSLLTLLMGSGLIMIVKEKSIWIDSLYANWAYPLIFKSREWFFSSFPFSIGDFLYVSIIVLLFIQLKKLSGKHWKDTLLLLFVSASVLFTWFQLSWGMNYYRTPMREQFSAEEKYSEKELIILTEFFADRSNELHAKLSKEDSLAIELEDDTVGLIKRMQLAYSVSDNVGRVKVSLFSIPLSYMGFSGYLNPFTLEAHINGRIPKIDLPITIAHEMAHQHGYAAENEANFIGFLNAYNHPDLDIQYAASLFGFRYCYAELRKVNPTKAKEIAQTLRSGIFLNFAASTAFWKAHQNPLEPLFKKSYDNYLKANNQSLGIQSYNQVVSLLLQQFKENQNFRPIKK